MGTPRRAIGVEDPRTPQTRPRRGTAAGPGTTAASRRRTGSVDRRHRGSGGGSTAQSAGSSPRRRPPDGRRLLVELPQQRPRSRRDRFGSSTGHRPSPGPPGWIAAIAGSILSRPHGDHTGHQTSALSRGRRDRQTRRRWSRLYNAAHPTPPWTPAGWAEADPRKRSSGAGAAGVAAEGQRVHGSTSDASTTRCADPHYAEGVPMRPRALRRSRGTM